jgi:folate-binding protein YgfZ
LSNQHFGNPLSEQRKLSEGNAIVLREDLKVIELKGEEAKKWLHSLTSQNILNLAAGDSTETLLLTPNGHIEFQIKIVVTDGSCLLIVASEQIAALTSWLSKMIFRTKVQILESDLLVVGTFKELELAAPCWVDGFSLSAQGSVQYAASRAQFPYREYLVSALPDIERAGLMAFEALRIAAGRPEITDIDDRSLPHEFDWLSSAVHLSKGCYRGQESVAKIHNLGHPPRRLIILHLEQGDVLANPGEAVFYGDKEVGKVLSATLHYELGSIALALVSRVTPYLDLQIAVGENRYVATQQVLVPHDAGKAANLPRPAAFKLSGRK